MITEEMRAAGWRECPTDEVRKAWEAKGGRWQVALHWFNIGKPRDRGAMTLIEGEERPREADEPYRPVDTTTWDYCPDGWGDAVKIERWLTEEDVETHGNLWRWWSRGWNNTHVVSKLATTYIEDGDVNICAGNEAGWRSVLYHDDYFTPARAG